MLSARISMVCSSVALLLVLVPGRVGAQEGGAPTAAATQGTTQAATPATPTPPAVDSGASQAPAHASPTGVSKPPVAREPQRPPPAAAADPFSPESEASRQRFHEWHRERYDRPWNLAVVGSYGVALDNVTRDANGMEVLLPNPYQGGMGGLIGYTTPRYNMYVGLHGTYFVGEDGFNVVRTGADLGYEFMSPHLRIRPFITSGLSILLSDRERTQYNAYLGAGFTLLVPMGPVFIGLDSRLQAVMGRSLAAASTSMISGMFGVRL